MPKSEHTGGLIERVTVRRSRLTDKKGAAEYLDVSDDTIDRLINAKALPVVRLPVQRTPHGVDPDGTSRIVRIDVQDLDDLIERNKDRGATDAGPIPVKLTTRRSG